MLRCWFCWIVLCLVGGLGLVAALVCLMLLLAIGRFADLRVTSLVLLCFWVSIVVSLCVYYVASVCWFCICCVVSCWVRLADAG